MDPARIGPPERIFAEHDLSGFDSGDPTLDDWLRRRALKNDETGASRTWVVSIGRQVIGYYALSTRAVAHTRGPGRVRRNMPDPLPVVVLARLAVDKSCQGAAQGRVFCEMPFCVRFRQRRLPASARFWCTRSPMRRSDFM